MERHSAGRCERARHVILNSVTCTLVGSHFPGPRKRLLRSSAYRPRAAPPFGGLACQRTSPMASALIKSAFIQGFQLDDYHAVAPLHSNSVIPLGARSWAQSRAGATKPGPSRERTCC
ncbi:hypothetical protein JB92DRAFT_2891491 [Gautieria morchelliformis]|nr:hypothetical protein JB92DRAFT_2891491 [Gautieria morchelliformis]